MYKNTGIGTYRYSYFERGGPVGVTFSSEHYYFLNLPLWGIGGGPGWTFRYLWNMDDENTTK